MRRESAGGHDKSLPSRRARSLPEFRSDRASEYLHETLVFNSLACWFILTARVVPRLRDYSFFIK